MAHHSDSKLSTDQGQTAETIQISETFMRNQYYSSSFSFLSALFTSSFSVISISIFNFIKCFTSKPNLFRSIKDEQSVHRWFFFSLFIYFLNINWCVWDECDSCNEWYTIFFCSFVFVNLYEKRVICGPCAICSAAISEASETIADQCSIFHRNGVPFKKFTELYCCVYLEI